MGKYVLIQKKKEKKYNHFIYETSLVSLTLNWKSKPSSKFLYLLSLIFIDSCRYLFSFIPHLCVLSELGI